MTIQKAKPNFKLSKIEEPRHKTKTPNKKNVPAYSTAKRIKNSSGIKRSSSSRISFSPPVVLSNSSIYFGLWKDYKYWTGKFLSHICRWMLAILISARL
jgi:hypothetical protein